MSDDREGMDRDEPAPRPRRSGKKRRADPDELTPEEEDEVARAQARSAGYSLLFGWVVISAMNAILFVSSVQAALNPPKDPKSIMAWNELGQFLLWSSSVTIPLGLLGLATGFMMLRCQWYWSAYVTSMLLLLYSFPAGIMCPALWYLPVHVLITLANRRVYHVCRLAGAGPRYASKPASDEEW